MVHLLMCELRSARCNDKKLKIKRLYLHYYTKTLHIITKYGT